MTIFLYQILVGTVFAAQFESAFMRMEIPDGWTCQLQAGQYLCQDEKYKAKNYAVLVVTAKQSSKEDTLASYKTFLSRPMQKVTSDFKELKSDVVKVSQSSRGGIEWIESVHKNSEAKGFITRYLATTHDGLSVLVSLSAHEKYFATFDQLFAKSWDTIRLLKINAKKAGVADRSAQLLNDQDPGSLDAGATSGTGALFVQRNSKPILGFAFLAVAALFGFIIYRRKR